VRGRMAPAHALKYLADWGRCQTGRSAVLGASPWYLTAWITSLSHREVAQGARGRIQAPLGRRR
jgi:hypothetical protein